MSILDKIFRRNQATTDDALDRIPDAPVATSPGGAIYSEDVVDYILTELERRRSDRTGYELQWTLNANFWAGRQNCDINTTSNSIVDEDNVLTLDKERRVYNRIAPLMETRHANLKAINYDMVVTPRTASMDDYGKAKTSSKILEYCQSVTSFDAQKDKLIAWAELTGTAFTLSYWDTDAGDVIGYASKPAQDSDGVILDEPSAVKSGDIAFGLLSSYEVFPESLTAQEIDDQANVIIEQVWSADRVYDAFGLRVNGESVEQYVMHAIDNGATGHGRSNVVFGVSRETREDAVRVITYIERPSRDFAEGRYITIIRDKIVYYGSLPGGVMPIVAFKAKTVSGHFFGKSVIQDLIPLQRSYNRIVNKIHDYIDTIANNGWLIPEGSISDPEAIATYGIESGASILYNPAFGAPNVIEYPDPPSIVVAERNQIAADMEYVAGVSQLMVYGNAPSGVTSGVAIDNLRQIDSTRMSLTGDNIRDGVVQMAKIWLKLNKRYSVGYRTIQIVGADDVGSAYTWSADDINSYDVSFSAENELRHSKDQQRQDFVTLYQMGAFTDASGAVPQSVKRRAWEMFGIADDAMITIDELQIKYARRENTFLEYGVMPQRTQYDDDEIHLDEHKRYAISMDFAIFKQNMPEYAAKFDAHIAEHEAALQQKKTQQIQAAMTAQGGK